MRIIIGVVFFTAIALTDLASQDKEFLNQFYVQERGNSVTLLFFDNDNIYLLSYHKPGQLGFCIESQYSIRGDTLLTVKFGKYVIKTKQLLLLSENEISQYPQKYKSVKSINKLIYSLKPYGIYLDSTKLVIPRHLIGGPY